MVRDEINQPRTRGVITTQDSERVYVGRVDDFGPRDRRCYKLDLHMAVTSDIWINGTPREPKRVRRKTAECPESVGGGQVVRCVWWRSSACGFDEGGTAPKVGRSKSVLRLEQSELRKYTNSKKICFHGG